MTSWKPGVAESSAKSAISSWTPAHEKSRQGGVVRDAAVLSAFGIGPDGRRRVLGVSVALSEAEVHWRAFLEDLVTRGMRGVQFVTSGDHAGLEAARKAVLGRAVPPRSADRVPFGSRMNGLLAIHG